MCPDFPLTNVWISCFLHRRAHPICSRNNSPESGHRIHSTSAITSSVSWDKSRHLLDLYEEDGNRFLLHIFLSSEFLTRKETFHKRPFKNPIQLHLPKYIFFVNQTVQNLEEKGFSGNFFNPSDFYPQCWFSNKQSYSFTHRTTFLRSLMLCVVRPKLPRAANCFPPASCSMHIYNFCLLLEIKKYGVIKEFAMGISNQPLSQTNFMTKQELGREKKWFMLSLTKHLNIRVDNISTPWDFM